MGHPLRPCGSRPKGAGVRGVCCIAAAIGFAIAGGMVLAVFSEPFEGSWNLGPRQHLPTNILPDEDAGVVGAVAADTNGLADVTRRTQEQQWKERRGNETLVSLTTAAALCTV